MSLLFFVVFFCAYRPYVEFALVLQFDRPLESAVAGAEQHVPNSAPRVQGARCCWMGSPSGLIPARDSRTSGDAIRCINRLRTKMKSTTSRIHEFTCSFLLIILSAMFYRACMVLSPISVSHTLYCLLHLDLLVV